MRVLMISLLLLTVLTACDELEETPTNSNSQIPIPVASPSPDDELARVTRVTDGDTIRVEINGVTEDVRYIGVNTPERDEPCYGRTGGATGANAALVEGETVRLVSDVSERDRFGRLLRYVYVGDVFVNAALVRDGWAEATRYEPDTVNFDLFVELEREAERGNLGCHSTGIFDDGTFNR